MLKNLITKYETVKNNMKQTRITMTKYINIYFSICIFIFKSGIWSFRLILILLKSNINYKYKLF